MSRSLYALRRVMRAAFSGLCAFTLSIFVAHSAAAQIIKTVAGTSDISGRPARSISIAPEGMTAAPDGTVYVADGLHSQVLRFDPSAQTFTVVAGTAIQGDSGDGGLATNAQLRYPTAVAIDPAGNLFIVDAGNGRIRKVNAATGVISTVAGGGSSTAEDEIATNALLRGPSSMVVDQYGSIFLVEQEANRVRWIDPYSGRINTIVGDGTMGTNCNEGWPRLMQLSRPSSIAIDAAGKIYIADQGNACVRVIDPATSMLKRYVGTGQRSGAVIDGMLGHETPLSSPGTVRVDAQGNLLVTDIDTNRVRKVDAVTKIVSTVAGGGSQFEGVLAAFGRIDRPTGLAVANNGDIYVSSQNTYLIQRISSTGMLDVVAGNTWSHFSGDGGYAPMAQMFPYSGIVNTNGDLFIIDNMRIRKVAADTENISTYAGDGPWGVVGDGGPAINAFFSYPTALTIDGVGNLFVGDRGNHRIRKIDAATGIISHYGGTGYGYGGDGGPAVNATMTEIRDMATDTAGNLYIIEEGGQLIRKIDAATGVINTIAGVRNTTLPWGDGQLATNVSLYQSDAIALDKQSNIFILQQNHVRRIDAVTGIITTIAGGPAGETGDGGPALAAGITARDLTLDAEGNIFITSYDSSRVRRIDATTGIITTVVGTGISGYEGDGGAALLASLFRPQALAFSAAGDLYITEQFRVRRVTGLGVQVPVIDTTAPTISYNLSAEPYSAAGWFNTDVTVNWSVSDAESSITSSLGCATTAVTNDTDGLTLTCTATSQGGTASNSVIIKRDTVGPSLIFGTPTPAANAAGWNNTDVVVPYTLSDDRAGIYESAGQVNVVGQGSNLRYSLSIADKAGNWSGFTTPAFKIDKTPPTATVAMPTNGGTYAFGATVNASYTCSDSFSTVSICLGTVPNGSAIDTATSGSKSFSITMTDVAGNVSTKTVTYNVSQPDTTPPVISYTMSSQPSGAPGWHKTNVTVSWTVTDQQSSITTSSGCVSTSITTDTPGITLTCTATSGGGTASKSVTIKRDATPPTIVFGAPIPAPNAAGWNNTDVTMPWTKSDNLSGIPGTNPSSLLMSGNAANIKYGMGFSDNAGNWTDVITPSVNIDKTLPTVAITSPSNGAGYAVGASVVAAYSCSDALSGVSSCAGNVPAGNAIDTATAGVKTFSVNVTDRAGNVVTTAVSYSVGVTPPPPPPPSSGPTYCTSRGTTSSYEWIQSVQAGSWTNTSNHNNGYGDFTANTPVPLVRGANSFTFSPGFGFGGYSEYWSVWIDFNQDGTFSSNENLFMTTSGGVFTRTLTIPTTALSGVTRMRVSMAWGGGPAACGNFSYGEVEDYRVAIP